MRPKSSLKYSRKFALFVDVLGFSQAIQDSSKTRKVFGIVSDFFNKVVNQSELQKLANELIPSSTRFHLFSDSVMITRDTQDSNDILFWEYPLWLYQSAIENGFLVRGHMSEGDVYDDGNIIFGPGVIDAVQNEKKNVVPVLSVSSRVSEMIQDEMENCTKGKVGYEIISWPKLSLLRSDISYLNIFSPGYTNWELNTYKKLRQIIIRGMKSDDPSIRAKYEWMLHQFNAEEDLKKLGLKNIN